MLVVGGAGANEDTTIAVLYGVVIVASVVYNTTMLAREGDRNGQTIGKHAMGIRVVPIAGGPMTMEIAARREAFGRTLLSLIPLYTFVDILWPITDDRNQALHDKVGRTVVVTADEVVTVEGLTYAPPVADPYEPRVLTEDESSAPDPEPADPPPPSPPEPDLGGFLPPAPAAPPPSRDDDVPGPFGPTYDDD